MAGEKDSQDLTLLPGPAEIMTRRKKVTINGALLPFAPDLDDVYLFAILRYFSGLIEGSPKFNPLLQTQVSGLILS